MEEQKRHNHLLEIRLEGEQVDGGRVAVSELTQLLAGVQLSVKRIGQVLYSDKPSKKKGRAKSLIEEACALEVAAFERGSFVVPFELQNTNRYMQAASLGDDAVRVLLEGITAINDSYSTVVKGFDANVLHTLGEVASILSKGISRIILSYKGQPVSVIDETTKRNIERNLAGDVIDYTVRGKVRAINLERCTCRILVSTNKYINCTFDVNATDVLKLGLSQRVEVFGEAKIRYVSSGRFEVVEMKIRDAEPVVPAFGGRPSRDYMTFTDLLESGLIGMWKDRTDIDEDGNFVTSHRKNSNGWI